MKRMVEALRNAGALFKTMEPLDLKALGIRKRIAGYMAVDTSGMYAALFYVEKKSRVLVKEAGELDAISQIVEQRAGHGVKKRFFVTTAPVCSKATAFLESNGWKVVPA